jgi:hypothetical protein
MVESLISESATSFQLLKEKALVSQENAALLLNWLGNIVFVKAEKQKNLL